MSRKVYCKNTACKHHSAQNKCNTVVQIGSNGKCNSFEKGFVYYIHLVWDALGSGNFIDASRFDDDMRIGAYYVMEMFHLNFSISEHGAWRWFSFKENKEGEALTYEEIVAREVDDEVFNQLYSDFMEGKMPGITKEEAKKDSQPFGWLSPTGTFTEGDWGEHEEVAEKIIEEQHFKTEYNAWLVDSLRDRLCSCRDFLSHIKGYCLIHNPGADGGYIVSNVKPLTKRQKDFLYGYFMDIGDRFKAEQYLE